MDVPAWKAILGYLETFHHILVVRWVIDTLQTRKDGKRS